MVFNQNYFYYIIIFCLLLFYLIKQLNIGVDSFNLESNLTKGMDVYGYKIVDKIGFGGYGVVFKVVDSETKKE